MRIRGVELPIDNYISGSILDSGERIDADIGVAIFTGENNIMNSTHCLFPSWAFVRIVGWIILDALVEDSRACQIMNARGPRGWVEIPCLTRRYAEEDTIENNRRNYWLEFGRYP